jgi:ribose 5-phosphate isomerase B
MTHIIIASDHRGTFLKKNIISYWEKEYNIIDSDPNVNETPVDYPDIVKNFSIKMKKNQKNFDALRIMPRVDPVGILICGTGIGVSITANRYKHLYAFVCHNEEEAFFARSHNNANVLCLGANHTTLEDANRWINIFVKTLFLRQRHEQRVKKINDVFCFCS